MAVVGEARRKNVKMSDEAPRWEKEKKKVE